MAQTRLKIAQRDIIEFFDKRRQAVYKRPEIEQVLSENREFWRLTQSTTVKKFIDFLKAINVLQEHKIQFPRRKEVRYVWGAASDYEVIQTLRPNSYYSHFTALSLHHLTLQIPKTVYLNYEQPKKKQPKGELAQERIDMAFRNACRVSRTIGEFRESRVCLLNGKHTGQLGVTDLADDTGKTIRVTDLERTLIDCVVRPVYAGGVHSVLEAFRRAAREVSINKLVAMLQALDYAYPYHQSIGFYVERSGAFRESQLAIVDRFPKDFDFYLAHQMKDIAYSERWRIYYPSGL